MGSLGDLLEQLDPDPGRRGKQGERLFQWYLQTDPVYAREYKHVWTWKEFPWQSPTGVEWRWKNDEAGIDLIAQDRDGDLTAIQIKTYDEATTVTMHDMARFVAESGREIFSHRLLIATTEKLAFNAEDLAGGAEKGGIDVLRRSGLESADVVWPASLSDLSAPQRLPWSPWDYQQDAINDVVNGFTVSNRGQMTMACGTGKTLISLWIKEEMNSRRTLVAVPSLALMRQTIREYRANQTLDFRVLPVCSDESVRHGHDVMSSVSELGLPTTTNPEMIAEKLRGDEPIVVFSTYHSLPAVAQAFALGDVPGFDLAIADEAHHTAGPIRKAAATILDDAKIPARCRLFMTATAKTFTARVVKAGEEADYQVASMDDTAKYGEQFHNLTFGKAIERRLLTDFQVAVMTIDKATDPDYLSAYLSAYRAWVEKRGYVALTDAEESRMANDLAVQVALIKAMRSTQDGGLGLRRNLLTANTKARAQHLTGGVNEVNTWMPEDQRFPGYVWSTCVDGTMPTREREERIRDLLKLDAHAPGVVGNARCLGEGIDVPAFDSITMVDPKRSVIDIIQAVGRILRLSAGKKIATVLLPVVVNSDEDVESAFNKSAFAAIRNTLLAMRSIDPERLGDQIDTIRRDQGKRPGGEAGPVKPLPNLFLIIPATVPTGFARAIGVKIVELTSARWEEWFGMLEEYVKENGNARVPVRGDGSNVNGYPLGKWVDRQRVQYKKRKLSADRILRLEELSDSWSWDLYTDDWEEGFRRVRDYAEREGNALVPQGYTVDDYNLGNWVNNQRNFYKKDKLDPDRIRRLKEVPGWSWDPHAVAWEKNFRQLKDYVEHNDCVPASGPLGRWVIRQRISYAKDRLRLDPDRISRLNEVPGWTWNARTDKWEEGFGRLWDYVKINGDALVKEGHMVDGYNLGDWAMTQRMNYAKGTLDRDRISRLTEVPSWVWNASDAKWAEMFNRLRRHIEDHGDARISRTCEDGKLRSWVAVQRQRYRKGVLDPGRIRRLQKLDGWDWNPPGRGH